MPTYFGIMKNEATGEMWLIEVPAHQPPAGPDIDSQGGPLYVGFAGDLGTSHGATHDSPPSSEPLIDPS